MRKVKGKDKLVDAHDNGLSDELERLANEKTALLKVLEKLQLEINHQCNDDHQDNNQCNENN